MTCAARQPWIFFARMPEGDKNANKNIFGSYLPDSSGDGISAAISPYYG
jgi:hypothetical protein